MFTYETNDRQTPLEKYEWDNVWWDSTEKTDAGRVLYIGDSISCGVRQHATAASGNTVFFDGFGTSKALDNPFFRPTLQVCLQQQPRRDAVLFNNGLHGWHLTEEAYEQEYRRMTEWLLSTVKEPLILLSTTDVANDDERQRRVEKRNEAVYRVAEKYGLPVVDLAAKAKEIGRPYPSDGVHFAEEGYRVLGAFLYEQVFRIIPFPG